MKSILQEMKKQYSVINESLRSTIDEPNFIEIAIRDAREALSIYADVSRNFHEITIYGSNVYASFNYNEISELLDIFDRHSIEVNEVVTEEEDLDEQNVTGAIAGYSTPNAFSKADDDTVEVLGYKRVKESINTKPSYKHGEHQRPESPEETSQDKFPFSSDLERWPNKVQEYPVKFTNNPYGTANIKDASEKSSLVAEAMDRKYEQLIEGYRNFATADPKISPEKKVKNTIKEIARKLQEIETMVNHNSRLKTESGVTSAAYGTSEKKALTKISERLIKISERVRSLGE